MKHYENSLREVRERIEQAFVGLPFVPDDPQSQFDALENICIAVLDSEHTQHVDGELQEYLQTYLYLRQLEFGLIEFPDPREA
jgi:hypothetical protein